MERNPMENPFAPADVEPGTLWLDNSQLPPELKIRLRSTTTWHAIGRVDESHTLEQVLESGDPHALAAFFCLYEHHARLKLRRLEEKIAAQRANLNRLERVVRIRAEAFENQRQTM